MGQVSGSRRFSLAAALALISFFFLSGISFADGIGARAAIVLDGSTGRILYAKNPDLKLMPASTTKLVTAMVALDKLNPDTVVTVRADAADVPSVSPHMRPGDRLTVRDLLYLALMRSVNGAAVALAEATAGTQQAFVPLMNQKVAAIGAVNTRYANASGLPAPDQYITAHDLSRIMIAALRYPLIKQIVSTREITIRDGRRNLYLRNTDKLLWANDDLIGGKTGYTRAAEHCLVFAAANGQDTLVAALLGDPVRDYLWRDGNTLIHKSEQVADGKAEPEIYVSDSRQGPVVLTSYNPYGSCSTRRIGRRRYVRRYSRRVMLSSRARRVRALSRRLTARRYRRHRRLHRRMLARHYRHHRHIRRRLVRHYRHLRHRKRAVLARHYHRKVISG
ncbi:MAG: serine hydrolase [Actinomycetota bacterium]|nr:serine hydrolase [Actinomycetota bacterium]